MAEITLDQIAQTMRRPSIDQLLGNAGKVGAAGTDAAGLADTAAAVAPASAAPVNIPPWLKSVGRFAPRLAKFGAGMAVAGQVAGMANNAADSTAGASYENRPERALKILSGADTFGVGGWIGRQLTGAPEPIAPNPMLTPDFNARVAAAGGANEYTKGFGAAPQPATATTPAPVPASVPSSPEGIFPDANGVYRQHTNAIDMPADPKAAAVLRFNLLQNDRDAARARYEALQPQGYNPTPAWGQALSRFNAAQTGMRAQVGEREAVVKESKASTEFAKALSTIGLQTAQSREALAKAKQTEAGGPALFGESLTSMPGKNGEIPIINKRTGAVSRVLPKPVITEADIQATMRSNKMSRAQVLQRLQDEGKM